MVGMSRRTAVASIAILSILLCTWTGTMAQRMPDYVLRPPQEAGTASFGEDLDGGPGRLIVGAPGRDLKVENIGSAFVYAWDGQSWILESEVLVEEVGQGTAFGWAVAIDGDEALVGARFASLLEPLSGAVFGVSREDLVWTDPFEIFASDQSSGDQFGTAVSMRNGVAMVGAGYAGDGILGAVYVFERISGNWVEQQRIESPTLSPTEFGHSVSLGADVAVVSAVFGDRAFVYEYVEDEWRLAAELSGPVGSEFGDSVDLEGDWLAIGAPLEDATGAVHMYRRTSEGWLEQTVLHASVGSAGDRFGRDVSIRSGGGTVLVGAPGASQYGEEAGLAFLFDWRDDQWQETEILAADEPHEGHQFGQSVFVANETAFVGAPGLDLNRGGVAAFSIAPLLDPPLPGLVDTYNLWFVTRCSPRTLTHLVYGLSLGETAISLCPGLSIGIEQPRLLDSVLADSNGIASFAKWVPRSARGRDVFFQAFISEPCARSEVVVATFN